MAVVGDLALKFGGMMNKEASVSLKKVLFGSPVPTCGVCVNPRKKWRNVHSRIGVQSVMQVGVESSEISPDDSKSFEGGLGFDVVSEVELREKGFLGLRKTKLVCTIGPACCTADDLEKLALGGMNVARLNLCHNTREWHLDVIRKIKKLNEEKGYCVSLMIDTEGSQTHVVDHGAPSSVKAEVINFKK